MFEINCNISVTIIWGTKDLHMWIKAINLLKELERSVKWPKFMLTYILNEEQYIFTHIPAQLIPIINKHKKKVCLSNS